MRHGYVATDEAADRPAIRPLPLVRRMKSASWTSDRPDSGASGGPDRHYMHRAHATGDEHASGARQGPVLARGATRAANLARGARRAGRAPRSVDPGGDLP